MSCKTKDAHWPIVKPQASGHPVPYEVCLIFQPTVLTSQREILPHLPSQHHLCILQGLVIEQPVQLCSLRWGMAVLVLDGDAVDGKSGAILEPGFHPVGVHVVAAGIHVVAAGKQFCHSRILQDLIFGVRSHEPMPSSRCRISRFFICLRVSARFLHGFCTVSKRAKCANRCKIGQGVQKLEVQNLRCIAEK